MTEPASRNAASLMRYDTVIRLTQYLPRDPEATQLLLARWPAEYAAASAPGVLYRELCRQVPEWSALAAREIDNPIDAPLLEYLIVEADTDLDTLPALPHDLAERFTLTQDLHTVAFRLTRPDAPADTGVRMFNLFEIDGPAGMEQGFLMDWPPRGFFKIRESATISTVLHQRMLLQATIKAFNRAEVTSAADYAEGIDRFEQAFPRAERKAAEGQLPPGARPPIRSHLGLFQRVASASGEPRQRPSMLAMVASSYGPPQVLQARQIPRPEPGPNQIRVRVLASSINPLDVKMRSGEVSGIYPSWFPDVLGYSVSGVVDAVGAGVTSRKPGEEVYGINNPIMRHGYAEFLVGPADNFYPKPARMDFPTAAAAPSVFATAYGALFLRSDLQRGQTALIHGGSGVIGSCAVQLAHQAGAHVTATASGKNVEAVRRLGADVVVDYKTQRFEDFARDVDLVVDTVGGETRERSWSLVRKGGVLASLLPPPPDQHRAAQLGIRAFMVHGHPNIVEIMPEMTRRLDSGELAFPEVAATFPLTEAAEAHRSFESSSPKGRIVLVTNAVV